MIQKEKDLLIQVLCTLLPYGVKIETIEGVQVFDIRWLAINMANIKNPYLPYLRSMSSMTEMEKQQFNLLSMNRIVSDGFGKDVQMYSIKCIDWLNKKKFDYRGLIPMGLALPAKDGMYDSEN